jgi:hypothetical protein
MNKEGVSEMTVEMSPLLATALYYMALSKGPFCLRSIGHLHGDIIVVQQYRNVAAPAPT